MRILDLCSGLGGASEAFVLAGWEVLRIENNPLLEGVEHTFIIDIFKFEEWLIENLDAIAKPDVIWASPPCRDFSTAYAAPGPTASRAGVVFKPDMSILLCCMRIIDLLKPTWWVVENVNGAQRHFHPVIGEYAQKLGPFLLWGNYPRINSCQGWANIKKQDAWSTNPLRPNIRAYVPIEISQGLLNAIANQKTLTEWIT